MHVVLTGTYCCCFQVTAPQVASLNLAFAVDNIIQSATLNGEPLTVAPNPTQFSSWTVLEGKMDAGSALFELGTNVLVVKVLNTYYFATNPYGFYAEGTAITYNCPPPPPSPPPPSPPKIHPSRPSPPPSPPCKENQDPDLHNCSPPPPSSPEPRKPSPPPPRPTKPPEPSPPPPKTKPAAPPPSPPPPLPPPPSPLPPRGPCQNSDGRRLTSDNPCLPGVVLSFGITVPQGDFPIK